MKNELKRKSVLSIEEDMAKRPVLFQYLNVMRQKANKEYGDISYQVISTIFWEVFSKLTPRERDIVMDYMVFGISANKSSIQNGLNRRTVENYRMRIKKKMASLIFNHLEVERVLIEMKKGK